MLADPKDPETGLAADTEQVVLYDLAGAKLLAQDTLFFERQKTWFVFCCYKIGNRYG